MQSLSYSALDKSQLEQVKDLFADDVFGTDAAAFIYEVDKRGVVVGRIAGSDQLSVNSRNATVRVTVRQEEVNGTGNMSMSTVALTAILAKKFMQRESELVLEEAHHE